MITSPDANGKHLSHKTARRLHSFFTQFFGLSCEHADVAHVTILMNMTVAHSLLYGAAVFMGMAAIGKGTQRHIRANLGEKPFHFLGNDVPQLALAEAGRIH